MQMTKNAKMNHYRLLHNAMDEFTVLFSMCQYLLNRDDMWQNDVRFTRLRVHCQGCQRALY